MSQGIEAATAQRPWSRRRRSNPLAASRRRMGLLFTLPVVALVSTLLLVPIGQTVYYSFTNWDGFTSQWIGFSAYTRLFNNPEFVTVLENNAAMVLAIPVAILLPLGVAFLINSHVRGWRFFRSVFFLPTAVSWVVIGYISVRFFSAAATVRAVHVPHQLDHGIQRALQPDLRDDRRRSGLRDDDARVLFLPA